MKDNGHIRAKVSVLAVSVVLLAAGLTAGISTPASAQEDPHGPEEEEGEPQHEGTDAGKEWSPSENESSPLLPGPLVLETSSNQLDREEDLDCELVPGGVSDTDYDGDGVEDSLDDDTDCDYISDSLEGLIGTSQKDRDTDGDGIEDFEDMNPTGFKLYVEVEVKEIHQDWELDGWAGYGDPYLKLDTGIGFHGTDGMVDRTMIFDGLTETNHQHDCETCIYGARERTLQDLPDDPADSFYNDAHSEPWEPPEMTFLTPLYDHDHNGDDKYVGADGFQQSLFYVSDGDFTEKTISYDPADMGFEWRTNASSCTFSILHQVHELRDDVVYPTDVPRDAAGGECHEPNE